jgi:hypothetical protein
MKYNAYTGEVEMPIAGKTGILLFNWQAIATLESKLGKHALAAVHSLPLSDLVEVLEIGFKAKSPEITREVILAASPAILPTLEYIKKASEFAYFGQDGAPKELLAEVESEEAKKKTV